MVRIEQLIDDAKCYEVVRNLLQGIGPDYRLFEGADMDLSPALPLPSVPSWLLAFPLDRLSKSHYQTFRAAKEIIIASPPFEMLHQL